MRFLLHPIYLIVVFNDAIKKGYFRIFNLELKALYLLLNKFHSKNEISSYKYIFAVLGPQSGL